MDVNSPSIKYSSPSRNSRLHTQKSPCPSATKTPSPTASEKAFISEQEKKTKILIEAQAKARLDITHQFKV